MEKFNKTIKNIKSSNHAHQQDLIEMFEYIYLKPKAYSSKDLSKEMNKSERTIKRMVKEINDFCTCIRKTVNYKDEYVYYYVDERLIKSDLETSFEKNQSYPLFYIFLKAFFVKPVSMLEISKELNISQKKAVMIKKKIFDANYLIDEIEYSNDIYILNWSLLYGKNTKKFFQSFKSLMQN